MDYVAGLCELLAVYVIGNKNKNGFLIAIMCNILWIVYVFTSTETYGLLIVSVPLFFMNVINYYKWKNSEKKVNDKQDNLF